MGWLCIYAIAIVACGLAICMSLCAPRTRLVELLGMSAILGSGAMSVILLWISMTGFKPQRISILAIGLLAIVAILLQFKLVGFPVLDRPFFPRMTGIDFAIFGLAAALIAIQILGASVAAIGMPALDIDSFEIWGLKAKVLFNQPLSPRPEYFSDLSLSFSHLDYPLLVPMLWAGASEMNRADFDSGKAALLVPLVGLVLLLYAALRDTLPRGRAALLTAIAIGAPVVVRSGGQGLADTTLAAFFLGASVSLMRWIRSGGIRSCLLVALFAAMAMYTKLEGGMIFVSTIGVMTAYAAVRRSIPQRGVAWLIAVIVAALLVLPWLIWSSDLPHTHENYGGRFTPDQIGQNLSRLPAIARLVLSEANSSSWTILAAMLLLCAALGWRAFRKADVLAGWMILLLQLTAYLCAYLVSPWDLRALISTSASRLLLHLAPLAALLAGMHWQASSRHEAA